MAEVNLRVRTDQKADEDSQRSDFLSLGDQLAIGGKTLLALAKGRRRYVRAITAVVSVFSIYARWKALGGDAERLPTVHREAAEKLANLARKNGGAWVKAAQFFSTRSDILPQSYIDALQPLQDEAQPIPFKRLEKSLINALGKNWRGYFKDFNPIPIATASIAQLHAATLTDGTPVAVKIRLPGVKKTFLQDVESFNLIVQLISPWIKEIDLVQVINQLVQMTIEELDFRNEAENLRRFAKLSHLPGIRVPTLHPKLSSESIMVSGWEEGERLRNYLEKHPDQAPQLLNLLLGSYLQQVTRFGVFQADPHPGNFLVNSKGEIVILDYGAMGRLSSDEVKRYSHLLYGLMGFLGDVDIAELFVEAGFVGGNAEVLKLLSDYMFTDKLQNMRPMDALEEVLTLFRQYRITIPDSYVALSRVLITLGGMMLAYNVPMDWSPPEQRKPAK